MSWRTTNASRASRNALRRDADHHALSARRFDGVELRVGQLHKPAPAHIPTIAVATRSGTHSYIALTAQNLLWRAHAYAIGFESWTPTALDPLAVRFARLVLTPHGKATIAMLRRAAAEMRRVLSAKNVDALPVLDGPSIVLWIPFDDAPGYDALRTWMHAIFAEAAVTAPDLFETRVNEPPDRIHCSAESNAPGHGSGLPYTLRPTAGLPLNLPIIWSELDTLGSETYNAANCAGRLAAGDIFATELARIGPQRFAVLERSTIAIASELAPPYELQPHSDVITVALQILADGKARSVENIFGEAVQRGLWPPSERKKYVYAMLKGYVEKMVARGLRPLIVQDSDRRFRTNHSADDLPPDPKPTATWSPPRDTISRLMAAANGVDPTVFEEAVAAAFEPFGFTSTHLGGTANPDAYVDAILGVLGYRVMIESKLNAKPLVRPDVFEAAKYREQYDAQYAIMVANSYAAEKETLDECRNHGVALWTVADLTRLLTIGTNANDSRALFAPGVACDALADLEWSRDHGAKKRLTVICDALLEAGWTAQAAAADFHSPADAPLLTEDAGIMLVDQYLSEHASRTPCTRADIRDAFAYLTSPRTANAIWSDEDRTAIVILQPPRDRS